MPVVAAAAVALAVCSALLGGEGRWRSGPPRRSTRSWRAGSPPPAPPSPTWASPGCRDGPGYALDTDATRRSPADLPRYGDDDLVPVGAAPARLTRDVTALLSGDPATVQAGAAELASSGTAAVVLPDPAVAERARAAGTPLLVPAAPTSDGRPVLTIDLPGGRRGHPRAAGLRRRDRRQGRPAPARRDHARCRPPRRRVGGADLARRRPAGGGGRRGAGVGLDGDRRRRPGDVVPAWGHLVGVSVPAGGGPVVVERDATLRGLLLLLQLALVLFTACRPCRRGRACA